MCLLIGKTSFHSFTIPCFILPHYYQNVLPPFIDACAKIQNVSAMFSHTKDVTFFPGLFFTAKNIKSMCLSFNYIGARIELKCHLGKCVLFGYRRRKDAPHCTIFFTCLLLKGHWMLLQRHSIRRWSLPFYYLHIAMQIFSKNLNDSDSRENFTISPLWLVFEKDLSQELFLVLFNVNINEVI